MKKVPIEFKVGFLFLAAVGLFIWGLNFLKGTDIFGQKRIFYAVYDHVEGLEPANKVKVSGLNIGQVKTLGFIPGTSLIFAELYIKNEIPIPKNSIARVYSTDLLGGKAIEIILGDAEELAKPGDTLISEMEQSIREQVNEQVEPIRKKALALINTVDSLLMNIQSVFTEDNQNNLATSFENIRYTIQSIKSATSTLDTILTSEKSRIDNIMGNIERISYNLKENNQQITNILRNVSTISDSLAVSELPQTLRDAQAAMANLKEISDKLNRGEGSMGQLLTNDTLYFNLQQSTENLNKLLEDLRLNPKRYVKFSMF
ncbi:MAG: MCE family protein [Bacteroidales bacterium]|nr:MCE family protein [Bacteroidales bacterium]